MSYHDVTHACGHSKTIKLEGKNIRSTHERKAEWIAKQPCDDCQFAARVRTARAGQKDQDSRLEPLTSGNDIQAAWALDIRKATIQEIDTDLAPKVERQKRDRPALIPAEAAKFDELMATVNQIVTECDANWWIDNRSSFDGAVSSDKLRLMALKRLD